MTAVRAKTNISNDRLVVRDDLARHLRRTVGNLHFESVKRQNVFGFFTVESVTTTVDALVARFAKKKNIAVPVKSAVNLHVAVKGTRAYTPDADFSIVLCADRIAAHNDDDLVVVVSFELTPTNDALLARDVRAFSRPDTISWCYGFDDTKAYGERDSVNISNADLSEALKRQCHALAGDRALPRLLLARLNEKFPIMTRLRCVERQLLIAAFVLPSSSSPAAANASAPSDGAVAAPAEVLDNACRSKIQTQLDRRTAWLETMLQQKAYTITVTLTGPCSKSALLQLSTTTVLPFDPVTDAVDAALWSRSAAGAAAPATWSYLLTRRRLLALCTNTGAAPPVQRRQQPAEIQASRAPLAASSFILLSESSASISLKASAMSLDAVADADNNNNNDERDGGGSIVQFFEPLRYFAHNIDPAQLTIYEIKTYARARLHWHIMRATIYKGSAKEVDSEDYPRKSGAHRGVLRQLGRAAMGRETHHEAIGVGMLALIAAPHEDLRDSLLYLEALSIEADYARHDDGMSDRKAAAVESRLDLLLRFWDLCGDVVYSSKSDASVTHRVMAAIASDWRQGLARYR